MGSEGAPIWLTGVIEKGCEELDKIQIDMRGCWVFHNEVDLPASHSRRAVETYSRVINIAMVVKYGEHVGGNGLMTLGPKTAKSEERHFRSFSHILFFGTIFLYPMLFFPLQKRKMCFFPLNLM